MKPTPAVVDPPVGSPLRVLLWSPLGSSENYHGPGSFAYRLYSSDPTIGLQVTLRTGIHSSPQRPCTLSNTSWHPTGQESWRCPVSCGKANAG